MNAEQKQRALTALGMWHSSNDSSQREYQAAELMAALLQELIDAPEPKPVLVVKVEPDYWYRGHYCEGSKPYINPLEVWKLPVGTKLYTAPRREPLSDERIFDLLKQVDPHAVRLPLGFKQFAIAIEREILGGNE